VGVVLFEVLTGELPIVSPTVMGLFSKVMTEPARRPSEVVPGIPAGLDELITQLLAKSADDRVPSAAVLVERLQALA
jgi:serine/threonine protein kinase